MNKLKKTIFVSGLLFGTCVLIPTLIVLPFQDKTGGSIIESIRSIEVVKGKTTDAVQKQEGPTVTIKRSATKETIKVPIEDYIKGVIASEMPASFEIEALKAQAVAARTYILKKMLDPTSQGQVTDTVQDQVYKSWEELEKIWASDYKWKREKIEQAVVETKGQVLIYNGQPITASFFSTSNGFTESSKDYWGGEQPYLKSVESPWDKESPKFNQQTVVTTKQFEQALGVKVTSNQLGAITARTTGKRVKEVSIGNKTFTGKEIREKLQLPSSDFTWEKKGANILVYTKGYGHGVGMSQYGANGLAKEGKSYQDIVSYYYKGVQLADIGKYATGLVAKN